MGGSSVQTHVRPTGPTQEFGGPTRPHGRTRQPFPLHRPSRRQRYMCEYGGDNERIWCAAGKRTDRAPSGRQPHLRLALFRPNEGGGRKQTDVNPLLTGSARPPPPSTWGGRRVLGKSAHNDNNSKPRNTPAEQRQRRRAAWAQPSASSSSSAPPPSAGPEQLVRPARPDRLAVLIGPASSSRDSQSSTRLPIWRKLCGE